MTDIIRTGLNNQKRKISIAKFDILEADLVSVGNAIVANLPQRIAVTAVKTIVTTASTTATSNITVKVGATSIATNVAVATTGLKATATPGYFATGGIVTVAPGTVPPAAGDLVCEVLIEYIELDVVTGEYVG